MPQPTTTLDPAASRALLVALDEHAIVSMTDVNGTIEYVNARFCEVSGYEASELIGGNHRLIKSGLHPLSFYLSMWADISSGKTWRGEICNRRKSGELYWVEATIVPEIDPWTGLPRRYTSIRTDITATKFAQHRAEVAEARYRSGQKFAHIGTWELNLQTNELYLPEPTTAMFGCPSGDRTITYENFLSMVHPEDREALLRAVKNCQENGAPYECEHRFLRPDGMTRWLSERGDLTCSPEDPSLRLLGVVRDITHCKEAEAELEKMRSNELARTTELAREHERRVQTELRVREQGALLEERGRLLSQREEMLAALAHEVRQPLNNASAALQSAAQAMSQQQIDRVRASERLRRAGAVLTQVTSALDNTLADAVLLGRTEPLARHDTDVGTLIKLVIADIDPNECGRIRCERMTDTRTASMNANLMRLALRNLIANALAYSPTDTSVVVRISDSDEPLALVIEVCDQGPGIPPELLPRLFSRGARGDQVNNPYGHGLGLHIVQRIMEMHGGEVQVQHDTPRGLTMRLVIPQGYSE